MPTQKQIKTKRNFAWHLWLAELLGNDPAKQNTRRMAHAHVPRGEDREGVALQYR